MKRIRMVQGTPGLEAVRRIVDAQNDRLLKLCPNLYLMCKLLAVKNEDFNSINPIAISRTGTIFIGPNNLCHTKTTVSVLYYIYIVCHICILKLHRLHKAAFAGISDMDCPLLLNWANVISPSEAVLESMMLSDSIFFVIWLVCLVKFLWNLL